MIAYPAAELSLATFFRSVYRPHRLPAASTSCIVQYERNIRRCGEHLGRDAYLSDLSDDLIAGIMGRLLTRGDSPSTANKVRSQLCALWRYAANRGMLAGGPLIAKCREYERVPVAWQKSQLARLFAACKDAPGMVGGVRARLWWTALHCVLWDTGVRISTLVWFAKPKELRNRGARWEQVDLSARTLLIPAESQKQKSDQLFKLHADTCAVLREIRCPSPFVFFWPMHLGTLYNHYKRMLAHAGLPTSRRDKFHKMRRSTASWFEAAGGNATELLGHSSRKVTRAYLDPSVVQREHASDVLFRPGDCCE